ncbi:hypothetical protein PS876_00583 [Pseudomonas fluorescens]|uniref:hypothetical protein n=1 Tax=Pseudomonas fluorescens TaxID=294 RepID=UPI001241D07D|nr:hypothetical protein [Pseudomonas fluorescens]VVO56850.1 hypothetical protein PS876_00583 [Pseudomonas fluorescens]
MLTADDWTAIHNVLLETVQNTETINKVWIAGSAVIVSLMAVVLGSLTQMWIAHRQRKVQLRLAGQQSDQQQQALAEQLSMQELASRRIANANVSAKRQVWIDELRNDIAKYLTLWQEISYRWDAIVSEPRLEPISDEDLAAFERPITEMRKEALELHLRIQLRLNATEIKHQDLKRLMNELERSTLLYQRTVSSFPPSVIQQQFRESLEGVVSKTQEILKEEWERVKKDSYADPNDSAYLQQKRAP